MRIMNMVVPMLAVCGVILTSGCEVEKTKDGDVTLPKYDVTKTQEGNVTVPSYEVKTPDVTVEEKKVEVTVPKVTTEKETITVPDVDVKPASEK
jgi:predicted RecA/RadA family phage recombinase